MTTMPVGEAKCRIERISGIRAVSVQRARGRDVLLVSASLVGTRRAREIEIRNGRVSEHVIADAIRSMLGHTAAAEFVVGGVL